MRTFRVAVAAAVIAMASGAACGGEDEGAIRFEGEQIEQARRGWAPGLVAVVDSGNAAYRAGDYDEAARIFRGGTERFPHQGAPWFGLYMAEHARGNIAAADSALARSEALTPSLPRDSADDATATDSVP